MLGDARSSRPVLADDVTGKPSLRGPNSPLRPYATRYEEHQPSQHDLCHGRQKL
jgi:hypothetical protein